MGFESAPNSTRASGVWFRVKGLGLGSRGSGECLGFRFEVRFEVCLRNLRAGLRCVEEGLG